MIIFDPFRDGIKIRFCTGIVEAAVVGSTFHAAMDSSVWIQWLRSLVCNLFVQQRRTPDNISAAAGMIAMSITRGIITPSRRTWISVHGFHSIVASNGNGTGVSDSRL